MANLQRQLINAKTQEEREDIEDQIAELEDEIEQEESDKYSSYDDE